jgi:hypothetical protein
MISVHDIIGKARPGQTVAHAPSAGTGMESLRLETHGHVRSRMEDGLTPGPAPVRRYTITVVSTTIMADRSP